MARFKHYRFGIDVAVGAKWSVSSVTINLWRWSWTLGGPNL